MLGEVAKNNKVSLGEKHGEKITSGGKPKGKFLLRKEKVPSGEKSKGKKEKS
jgi:hypothetical protein